MKCASIKLFVGLALSLLAVTGCRQEDIRPQAESDGMGRIVLSLSNSDIWLDIETRAEMETFEGYVFTLKPDGEAGETITFTDDGTAIVEAGTYTLKADNLDPSQEGLGAPYYSGESEEFTVSAGETAEVSINLGKPKNAKITVVLDKSFTDLYDTEKRSDTEKESISLTFSGASSSGDDREVNLDGSHFKSDDISTTVDASAGQAMTSDPFFFAVSSDDEEAEASLSYTLSALAKKDAHITDISSLQGTLNIKKGCHTTLTLKANPVSGELIPVIDGDYDNEFD